MNSSDPDWLYHLELGWEPPPKDSEAEMSDLSKWSEIIKKSGEQAHQRRTIYRQALSAAQRENPIEDDLKEIFDAVDSLCRMNQMHIQCSEEEVGQVIEAYHQRMERLRQLCTDYKHSPAKT